MSRPLVIEDSDDDEEEIEIADVGIAGVSSALELSSAIGASHVLSNQPSSRIDTSSTDPVLFQAVYDAHCPDLQTSAEGQSGANNDSLEDQDSAIGQRFARKKDGKAQNSYGNTASLTSISDPPTSSRIKKRKITTNIEEATPVTSPGNSKDTAEKDIWEFTSSNSLDMNVRFKSRNAEKGTLKTYGKPARKNKTLELTSSCSRGESPRHLMEDMQTTRKRPVLHVDGSVELPDLPRPKRFKRGISEERDDLGESNKLSNVEVPRTTSDESHLLSNEPQQDHLNSASGTSMVKQTDSNITSEDRSDLNGLKESMVLIPDTLTSSQRKEYKLVEIDSSDRREETNFQHIMESSNIVLKYTGDSSTVPNETPLLEKSLLSEIERAMSSSPPVSSLKRRRKRSGSPTERPSLSESFRSLKSRGRSKAKAGEENIVQRESSVDELHSESLLSTDIPSSRKSGSSKNKKKRDDDESVEVDELFGSDDVGLPRELYRPRPSSRRSKSLSIQETSSILISDVVLKTPARQRKSKKGASSIPSFSGDEGTDLAPTLHESVISEDPAVPDEEEEQVQPGAGDTSEAIIEIVDTIDLPEEPAPLPKRKRGRPPKKTPVVKDQEREEVVDAEDIPTLSSKHDLDADSKSSSQKTDIKSQPLHDTDPNKNQASQASQQQQSQEDLNSTEESNEDSDVNNHNNSTQTKHPSTPKKKGPAGNKSGTGAGTGGPAGSATDHHQQQHQQQHSPIQSSSGDGGKVPYRVGLSRRSRIAPLLKVIRK